MEKQLVIQRDASGRKLELWLGDLTEMPVDVIVNAANDRLEHGGGVAGAIVRKGGAGIQIESDLIGSCPTGTAVVTGGGWLPARWVIHTVAPMGGSSTQNDQLMVNAIWNTLLLAHRMGVRTLAIPPIGTGIFGFPKRRAAQLLLFTAERFFAGHERSNLETVLVVTNGLESLETFQEVFLAPEGAEGPAPLTPTKARAPKGERKMGKGRGMPEIPLEGDPFACGWCADRGCSRCQTEPEAGEAEQSGREAGEVPVFDQISRLLPMYILSKLAEKAEEYVLQGEKPDQDLYEWMVNIVKLQSRCHVQTAQDYVLAMIADCRLARAAQQAKKAQVA